MGPDWVAPALTDGDTLQMSEIDIELALGEIYSDVTFDAPANPDDVASPPA
jgi:hypothetical protein